MAKTEKIIVKEYQEKYPKLVKPFTGQNPRITNNYARFRQLPPSAFEPGKFRTKRVSDKTELVLGKRKGAKKWSVQSILIRR